MHINLGVKQGCPMSPTLLFVDEISRNGHYVSTNNFKIDNTLLNAILLADYQAICSKSEAVNRLEHIANGFNIRFSATKTKTTEFQGKIHKRIEKVSNFNYLGFNVRIILSKRRRKTKLSL
jgi:hypothetical protein